LLGRAQPALPDLLKSSGLWQARPMDLSDLCMCVCVCVSVCVCGWVGAWVSLTHGSQSAYSQKLRFAYNMLKQTCISGGACVFVCGRFYMCLCRCVYWGGGEAEAALDCVSLLARALLYFH